MSNSNTGGPAFPVSAIIYNENGKEPTTIINDGMTLRDYFAAKALQGICASGPSDSWTDDMLAKDAYKLADAMLAARIAK